MALDAEYFDSIYIDVVKKKFYNANKVRTVFEEIRRQAEALNAENIQLRRQLASEQERKVELGDALLSAQSVYQDIVEKAKARAAAITAEAEQRSAAMLAEARFKSEQLLADSNRQQEYAVQRVENAFNRMKQLHLANIDALNAEWQDFLCGLYPEPESVGQPSREDAPEDLEQKVSAIADQVFSLEGDD